MKNIRRLIIALILCCASQGYTYSQTMEWKENYSYTVLQDDFSNSQIDRNKWTVVDNEYQFHTAFIDSSATIGIDGGSLRLTSIMCSNCPVGTYTEIHAAAAKIVSKDKFQYGIFESRIHFPKKEGTSAFFTLRGGNGVPCSQGGTYENEIDIAHSWYRQVYPNFHTSHEIIHYHTGTNCVEAYLGVDWESYYYNYQESSSYRIYKCVWTPSYVRYYNNGNMVHEVINTGEECDECNKEWFPEYPMNLSFWQYFLTDVLLYMDAPQSTYIDYVSVKRFFATPEIILSSDAICSSGSATLNVDPEATNISWSLSPAKYFTGATTGSGKNASFTVSSYASGEATITYSFEMPSGEKFTAEESFWAGPEEATVFSPFDLNQNAYNWYLTTGTPFEFRASLAHPSDNAADYIWTVWDEQQQIMTLCPPGTGGAFTATHAGYYTVNLKFNNGCGWGDIRSQQFEFIDGGGFLLMASPNPTSGETTISIEKSAPADESLIQYSDENSFDENEEWDLAIYDNVKNLKLKKDKLKGKSFVLKTHGWKEGIYMIRAKYKNEIIQGKLIVKK